MGAVLENLSRAVALGVVILLLLIFTLHRGVLTDPSWDTGIVIYAHVIAGVMWIGLLYYFNFVQIPTMPKVPAELKPGVSKFIAPEALFWFRWAALVTVIAGVGVIQLKEGSLIAVLSFQAPFRIIGIGAWLALVMAFNVWFIIWPSQKIALGLVPAEDAAKPKAARRAMLFSRTNTVLSIPMLYCMIMQGYSPL